MFSTSVSIVSLFSQLLVVVVGGFLLDNECPALPPCTCRFGSDPLIECFGIQKIPFFRNVSTRMSNNWSISINYNGLETVPDYAFSNLKSFSNGHYITISLAHNLLQNTSFGGMAFSDIEDLIIKLDISWNNLTTIPTIISKLKQLETLLIYENPIQSIDPYVFISLKHTLKFLDIDMYGIQTWPAAFQYLTSLESFALTVMEGEIPSDAFSGFNSTLTYLKLISFLTMPLAVCRLDHLETFEVEANYVDLSLKNLLKCPSPITSVRNIKFIVNFYDRFPFVFQVFPLLENLEIGSCSTNGSTFVNESLIPNNTSLKTFKINFCGLTSIPLSVNKLQHLEVCDLSNNEIRRIETNSFVSLQFLREINLDANRIYFISTDALNNLTSLTQLSLKFNFITTIPQTIQNLPSLTYLNLEYNQLNCSCNFPWMKSWPVLTTILVNGICHVSVGSSPSILITLGHNCT